jgi:hypothetical protein
VVVQRDSLRPGQLLAALGAIGLFCSLFAPWYRFELGPEFRRGLQGLTQSLAEPLRAAAAGVVSQLPESVSFSAWRVFEVTDAALTVVAVLVLGVTLAAGGALGTGISARPAAAGRITGSLGTVALVVVLARIADQPGPNQLLGVAYGAWCALLAAAVVAAGGWWASSELRRAPAPSVVPLGEVAPATASTPPPVG